MKSKKYQSLKKKKYKKTKSLKKRTKKKRTYKKKQKAGNNNLSISKDIKNTKSLFDKAYIINLDRREDRMENIENACRKINLKYERFSACDGENLNKYKEDIDKYFDKNHNLIPAQIGCALSHIKIWEKILENNYNNTLILEDDAIIPNNFWDQINLVINELPNYWEMLILGCFPKCNSKNIIEKKYINKITGYGNDGSHAYLINKTLIEKIIRVINLYPINIPIDTWLQKYIYINNNNIFNTKEQMIFQNRQQFKSDICPHCEWGKSVKKA